MSPINDLDLPTWLDPDAPTSSPVVSPVAKQRLCRQQIRETKRQIKKVESELIAGIHKPFVISPYDEMALRDTLGQYDETLTADQMLADLLGECVGDPLKYVLSNFSWGKAGTHLSDRRYPDVWQRDALIELGQEIRLRAFNGADAVLPILVYIASGHGIGKSAYFAMAAKFILDTRPFARITATSNTMSQLKARTFSELIKWNSVSLTQHWWEKTTGAHLSLYHKEFPDNWRLDALPADPTKSEAFAGQHNASSTSAYLVDEASNIHEKIVEVMDGGLTDGEPIVMMFGNPTRNTGAFYRAMTDPSREKEVIRRHIDSRESNITNKDYIASLFRLHDEDSDYIRVRVKGQFPRAGSIQFISNEDVDACIDAEHIPTKYDPIIMGLDVARTGDDSSVIAIRQGRNARTLNLPNIADIPDLSFIQTIQSFDSPDTMDFVNRVKLIVDMIKPDAIFIDSNGVGAGATDRLRELGVPNVIDVFGSATPTNPMMYANMRANMWGNMRDYIRNGGLALPRENPSVEPSQDICTQLKQELTSIEYGFDNKDRILLEKKSDMKKRGLSSPDMADALAMTFAYNVVSKGEMELDSSNHNSVRHNSEYNPVYDDEEW